MDVRILSDAERERIARDYGVVKVPAKAVVVPRGVSAFDPVTGEHWQEQRNKGRRILERRRKFAAINARLEADKRAEALHEQREREKAARLIEQKEARTAKARKAREKAAKTAARKAAAAAAKSERQAKAAAKAAEQHATDMRWLELVRQGVGHRKAAKQVGVTHGFNVARRLRAQGIEVPVMPLEEAITRRKRGASPDTALRDERWLSLVNGGMSHKDALREIGLKQHSLDDVRRRLRARGFELPPDERPAPAWWADVYRMRAEGQSYRQIMAVLGRSMSQIALVISRGASK